MYLYKKRNDTIASSLYGTPTSGLNAQVTLVQHEPQSPSFWAATLKLQLAYMNMFPNILHPPRFQTDLGKLLQISREVLKHRKEATATVHQVAGRLLRDGNSGLENMHTFQTWLVTLLLPERC